MYLVKYAERSLSYLFGHCDWHISAFAWKTSFLWQICLEMGVKRRRRRKIGFCKFSSTSPQIADGNYQLAFQYHHSSTYSSSYLCGVWTVVRSLESPSTAFQTCIYVCACMHIVSSCFLFVLRKVIDAFLLLLPPNLFWFKSMLRENCGSYWILRSHFRYEL